MSNINPIPATKVAAGSGSAATSAQALQGSGNGVFSAVAGANFFDLIIARLAAAENNGQITPASTTTPDTTTTALTAGQTAALTSNTTPALPSQSDNPLVQLQVALASQTLDANGNIVLSADTQSAGTDKLQTQLDFTNQIINHLKNMLPDSAEKEGIFAKLLSKLQTKSDNLQASLSALEHGIITKDTAVEDIPMPMLISLGLSPAQISQVTDKIQSLEKKLGRDITVEDLIAGVGGIVPPAPDGTLTASAALSVGAPQQPVQENAKKSNASDITGGIDENTKPSDDLAARLNALEVGGKQDAKTAADKAATDPEKKMKGLLDPTEKATPVSKDATTPVDSQIKKPVMNFKENLVNMMNNAKSQNGDMVFPITSTSGDADASIMQQYGLTPSPTLSLGTTAQAANVIATTTSAGDAHPATNMVAAQISKFADANGDQTMQIRLDPPELGNVAVRLQIAKDKGVKAHLVIEKPETYMMLQRDAHSLERALQHAGLDTNASSITFELANQDGGGANNNSQNNNDNFGGGKAGLQDVGAADEIIQSSVTWQVDPSTGQVRYNIFA